MSTNSVYIVSRRKVNRQGTESLRAIYDSEEDALEHCRLRAEESLTRPGEEVEEGVGEFEPPVQADGILNRTPDKECSFVRGEKTVFVVHEHPLNDIERAREKIQTE